MSCEGAKERRDGLIADMVTLQDHIGIDALRYAAAANNVVINASDKVTMFFVGYLAATVERLAAAVIALAGPCCEDCEDDPGEVRRTWCCGTSITQPHVPGCSFEPREDNSPWRAG